MIRDCLYKELFRLLLTALSCRQQLLQKVKCYRINSKNSRKVTQILCKSSFFIYSVISFVSFWDLKSFQSCFKVYWMLWYQCFHSCLNEIQICEKISLKSTRGRWLWFQYIKSKKGNPFELLDFLRNNLISTPWRLAHFF